MPSPKGDATVKNSSGDTVIGKKSESHYREARLESIAVCLTTAPVAVFALADGSNSFLNISSVSGSIDAYVGDGASAEIHTREGKTVRKASSSVASFPNYSLIHRSGVRARSRLAASCRGAKRNGGGSQPGGGSPRSPDKRSRGPDDRHW